METAKRVLVADYAWPDLDLEKRILSTINAEVIVAPDTSVETLTRLAADVDAIMTCWAQIQRPVLEQATRCRMVARFGIGLDNIDVGYCTERGIVVTNVPDYCTREVAEHTLALLFSLGRKIGFFHHATQSGSYDLQAGLPLRQLQGQVVGVVGWGNIGQEVGRLASALGMHVCTLRRSRRRSGPAIEYCDWNTLLRQSDFVTLHVPLTDETRYLIGPSELQAMKRGAFLINTSRGPLIDHNALAAALAENEIAGAGLDVQDPEPPDLSQPPYCDPRVIVTPHAAFVSEESVAALRRRTASQVVDYLTGQTPENIVNPSARR